jgi:hypothetical protein
VQGCGGPDTNGICHAPAMPIASTTCCCQFIHASFLLCSCFPPVQGAAGHLVGHTNTAADSYDLLLPHTTTISHCAHVLSVHYQCREMLGTGTNGLDHSDTHQDDYIITAASHSNNNQPLLTCLAIAGRCWAPAPTAWATATHNSIQFVLSEPAAATAPSKRLPLFTCPTFAGRCWAPAPTGWATATRARRSSTTSS